MSSAAPADDPAPAVAEHVECSAETIDAVVAGTAAWTDEGPVCLSELEQGCARGDGDACVLAGTILLNGLGGVKADPGAALQLEVDACNRDVASACLVAGMLHQRGTGTAVNVVEAAAEFQRACELGNDQGCAALASMESPPAAE